MNNKDSSKIVIAGGGSGGHIYPALAIADGLVELGLVKDQIIFFGSKRAMEKDIVPAAGYKLVTLPGRGLNKNESLKNFINVFGILFACMKAFFLFLIDRPNIIVGVGGYASVPAIFAGTILWIPRVVHEQNAYLGRTNKLAERFGAKLATTFEQTGGTNSVGKVVGLPMSKDMETSVAERVSFLKSNQAKRAVVVSGGSLGSKALNDSTVSMMNDHRDEIDFQLIHICGTNNFDEVSKQYEKLGLSKNVALHSYRDDIDTIYARSNCVVARAGAGTCVELQTLALNCVLVPLPSAPNDHQRRNAKELVDTGHCLLLDQSELDGDSLFDSIAKVLEFNSIEPFNTFHLEGRRRMAVYVLELARVQF